MELQRQAVCLIVKRDKLSLGVSRKADHCDWGLPAGSVEHDESPLEAITRELREETGLCLERAVLLDQRTWGEYYVHCYLAEEVSGELFSDADTDKNGEGRVRWLDDHNLFQGTFGDYNQAIFDEYRARINR